MKVAISAARQRPTTRAEQAAVTRARLVNATLESLVELGYAGTSTTVVCAVAGVSRGAQLHHFATKLDLIQAAIDELAARLDRRVRRQQFGSAADDPIGTAIERQWARFSSPEALGFLELWSASRHDEELAAVLRPVQRRLEQAVSRELETALGDFRHHPTMPAVVRTTMTLMQGWLAEHLMEEAGLRERQHARCEEWKALARHLLS